MTKDEALNLALQLVSNLRTHSWTVADEQLVIIAIKEALAQPEPEYLAFMDTPQRLWVGLTDEEIQYCVELKNPEAIAEEVEAKLKEKNT